MPKSFRKHLISVVCTFFSNSAVRVHVSQAYRKIEMTKDRISLILELSAMFLSFNMVLSLVNAQIVWAILDIISCFDPSSVTTEPKYLKFWTVSSFWPQILTSKLIPLVLLVISLVFSALISMPYFVDVVSRWLINLTSSSSFPARASTSSAKRRLVIVLPPMLTDPSWFSKASVMILSRKMLKRVQHMPLLITAFLCTTSNSCTYGHINSPPERQISTV